MCNNTLVFDIRQLLIHVSVVMLVFTGTFGVYAKLPRGDIQQPLPDVQNGWLHYRCE